MHVYQEFPEHQFTFGWYSVNKVSGSVINLVERAQVKTASGDTLARNNDLYTLPAGWKAEMYLQPAEMGFLAEGFWISKGDYKLKIDNQSSGGGRAWCAYNTNQSPIQNNNLGNSVVRKIPEQTDYDSSLKAIWFSVCSEASDAKAMEVGTRLGHIGYYLPEKWDEDTLQEMDSIVESLRIVK